jgi:ABC-type nitrate/sulfonate/bicarbonate transport system permease component
MKASSRSTPVVAARLPRIGPRVSHINLNVWRFLVFVAIVLVWALVARNAGRFFPSPLETANAAIVLFKGGELYGAVASSFCTLAGGYLLAAAVGIPLGLIFGGIPVLSALFDPYIDALSSMPRVAFLPLIIVFLGLGYEAKIFLVFLGAVMPILVNTIAGVKAGDHELIEMARSAGATGSAIFTKIMLPGALPFIMTGLRIGASLALINTVVAELYTAVEGLGGLLSVYGSGFRMAPYFVVVIILALIGVAIMHGLRAIEKSATGWRRGSWN